MNKLLLVLLITLVIATIAVQYGMAEEEEHHARLKRQWAGAVGDAQDGEADGVVLGDGAVDGEEDGAVDGDEDGADGADAK
uniref:Uncharacterized protein n=1 Tax=Meloidogyne hapla TaxID=6305 RepID=A0A1I8BWD2_MELHA